jgi:hypothetical protein
VEARPINHQELKEYLLGRLPADRKAAVEQAFLTSTRIYDELLIVEDELFEAYRHGELSPEDLKSFESRRAVSVVWQDRNAFERALQEHAKPVQIPRTSWMEYVSGVLDRIAEMFTLPPARWAVGSAFLVVVMLLGRSWWLERQKDSQLLSEMAFVVDVETTGMRGEKIEIGKRGSEPVGEAPNARVITGSDQYAVTMSPGEPVHVYALQWDTAGNVTVLFPNAEVSDAVNPVSPDSAFRIPPSPGWLAVDKDPGVETIGIIASTQPWPEVEQQVDVIRKGMYVQKIDAFARFRSLMQIAEQDPRDGRVARQFSFILKK